jgi:ribosome recycling factor
VDGNITVARKDINDALELYSHISVTQNLGISPYHHTLYNEVIKPCYMEKLGLNFGHDISGITYQDILNYNYKHKKLKLGYNDLRMQVIPELEACGLVEKEYSTENQRKVMIYVIEKSAEELKEQAISEVMSRDIDNDFSDL